MMVNLRTTLRNVLVLSVCAELVLRLLGSAYVQYHYRNLFRAVRRGKTVILCVGESSTAGLWVQVEDSYPKQLERLLNQRAHSEQFLSVAPPLLGQNTSQMAHRIEPYLKEWRPQLLILMAGVNNEWSLAESSAVKFLKNGSPVEALQLHAIVFFSNCRVCKVLRYVGKRFFTSHEAKGFDMPSYDPVYSEFPPRKDMYELARRHEAAFVEAWRYDMAQMIHAAQAYHVNVLLMTYPINPVYLSEKEFVHLAQEYHIPLVRNDQIFSTRMGLPTGKAEEYLFRDHWHPNEKGYYLIAQNALEAILRDHLIDDRLDESTSSNVANNCICLVKGIGRILLAVGVREDCREYDSAGRWCEV